MPGLLQRAAAGPTIRHAGRPLDRRRYAAPLLSSRTLHHSPLRANEHAQDKAGESSSSGSSSSFGSSSTSGSPSSSAADTAARRQNVLSQIRDVLNRKRSDLEPRIKQHLDELGRRWNEYSGYEEVVEAKAQVLEAEVQLKELRDRQGVLRQEYMQAVQRRAASQRTLNELLTRKDTWSEPDLARYTELLRAEHNDARNEREATERYEAIGKQVNAAWDDVVRKTLDRYHQEQIWSDRVRAGSTYGSLLIAGVNVLLFVLAFVIVEPYKRRKLAKTFEKRLLEGETVNSQLLARVVQEFQEHIDKLQGSAAGMEESLAMLMSKAGIPAGGEEGLGGSDGGGPASNGPAAVAPVQQQLQRVQTRNEKRRDMAMAGALGFTVGAGLLAAFGALQS